MINLLKIRSIVYIRSTQMCIDNILRHVISLSIVVTSSILCTNAQSNPLNDPHFANTPTFADEFNSFTPNTDWWPQFPWGPTIGGVTLDVATVNNISVNNGVLSLTPKKEQIVYQGNTYDYTTGIISNTQLFGYGFYEMKARLPKGQGYHSAFWTIHAGTCIYEEIDILEIDGGHSVTCEQIIPNHHWRSTIDPGCPRKHDPMPVETGLDLSQNFHTYGLSYLPGELVWYFDGEVIRRLAVTSSYPYPPLPNDALIPSGPIRIIIGTGFAVWNPPDHTTPFGQESMDIDYFRYFEYDIESDCTLDVICSFNPSTHQYQIKDEIHIGDGSCSVSILANTTNNTIFRAEKGITIKENATLQPGNNDIICLVTECL